MNSQPTSGGREGEAVRCEFITYRLRAGWESGCHFRAQEVSIFRALPFKRPSLRISPHPNQYVPPHIKNNRYINSYCELQAGEQPVQRGGNVPARHRLLGQSRCSGQSQAPAPLKGQSFKISIKETAIRNMTVFPLGQSRCSGQSQAPAPLKG